MREPSRRGSARRDAPCATSTRSSGTGEYARRTDPVTSAAPLGDRPLRVVHCPVNIAGIPWQNVLALRRKGVDAQLVVFNRMKLHPDADADLERPASSLLRMQARQWRALARLLPQTDVF